ncbi:MAG TPA: type II secretion system F family protein [Gemmatimonas sp.]|uniref:type II secretion system F family protein n=1 Tax=Gemmatimonas sp. TaxID=1962908 RepID=UPI002ED7C374
MSGGARWHYRAADTAGREHEGDLTATSADDALAQLRARTLWVIDLRPQTAGGAIAPGAVSMTDGSIGPRTMTGERSLQHTLSAWWSRVSGRDAEVLATLVRGMATLLAAGVPVDKALAHADAIGDGGGDARWRGAFARIRNRVRGGEPLSAALAAEPDLPSIMAPTAAAAEATGSLASAFEGLAEYLERGAELRARVRGALTYPALLAASSIVATLVIVLVVVPRFASLLTDTGAELPASTRVLVAVSALVGRWWWLMLAAAVLAVVAMRQSLQSADGRRRWHAWRLTVPVAGEAERQLDIARYLRTLALALGSGVSLLRAMALARATVQNVALADALEPAERDVRDGQPLARAVGVHLPPLSRQLLETGEAAGALAPLAARAATASEQEAQRTIGRVVSLLEPLLILGLGGLVGFVALALLQAIYGLNSGVL